ncbi:MAG: 50S ribosomal protein L20 [Candidatus Komeilibacteria bacterium]|nr:50S ribosomal protein L20 [Candidatus Komeilibacteria bacterium]
MTRIKRGIIHLKKRRNILTKAKGFRWGRKNKVKLAKTAVRKAGTNAYRDRKNNKRAKRGLWQVKINAAARTQNISYSKLIDQLKKKGIILDRKILATLAEKYPTVFEKIVKA